MKEETLARAEEELVEQLDNKEITLSEYNAAIKELYAQAYGVCYNDLGREDI